MRLTNSARKHYAECSLCDEDVLTAWRNMILYAEFEYQGEYRFLAIGVDAKGRELELVAVDLPQPNRIIHAMPAREKFRAMIRGRAAGWQS